VHFDWKDANVFSPFFFKLSHKQNVESEGGDRVEDAPAVMITSPEALEKAAAPKCDCGMPLAN
jgi:hypothetical protein